MERRLFGWLRNPHYKAGVLVARGIVTLATLLLGLELLMLENAMGHRYYGTLILAPHEDPLGFLCVASSLYQMYLLVRQRAGGVLSILACALATFMWSYAATISLFFLPRIPLFGAPCILVVAFCAWWSFLVWPATMHEDKVRGVRWDS